MSKVVIQTVASLEDESSALGKINENFTELANQVEKSLSRTGLNEDGTPNTDNTLHSTIDANNQRIINLPVPVSNSEPARHGDLQQYVDQAQTAATAADASADAALASQVAAHTSEQNAQASLDQFESVWEGELAVEPTLDLNGNALKQGALYYDSALHALRVFDVQRVFVGVDEVFVGVDNVVVSKWLTLPSNLLATLADVNVSGITNGQLLQWNSGTATFQPVNFPSFNIVTLEAFLVGIPTASVALFKWIIPVAMNFADDFSGSFARCVTGPSVGIAFDIQKNGASIGTLSFNTAATSGTFVTAGGAVSLAAGDTLAIIAPSDLKTASDFGVALSGTL